ncbi:MAG: GDSL-type esterase/lipase family protein [bacterium]
MEKIICVFSDSVGWGAWDHEQGGWVNRLRLALDSKDCFVYNLSVDGNTTKDLLERFDTEAKVRQPDIIIFSIGDNDSVHVKSKNSNLVPLEQFGNNLRQLITQARKFTDNIVFLGCGQADESKTTPIPWETDYHYRNDYLKQYDSVIKEVVLENNCLYLSVFDLLAKEDLEDGLHPNAQGHKKLFEAVKEFLEKNNIC